MLVVSDGVFTGTDEVTAYKVPETGTCDLAVGSQMAIFLNPSKWYFTVFVPGGNAEEVQLVDFAGKIIMHRIWTGEREETFRMEGITPGVYVVVVHTADEVYQKRMIIL